MKLLQWCDISYIKSVKQTFTGIGITCFILIKPFWVVQKLFIDLEFSFDQTRQISFKLKSPELLKRDSFLEF